MRKIVGDSVPKPLQGALPLDPGRDFAPAPRNRILPAAKFMREVQKIIRGVQGARSPHGFP